MESIFRHEEQSTHPSFRIVFEINITLISNVLEQFTYNSYTTIPASHPIPHLSHTLFDEYILSGKTR